MAATFHRTYKGVAIYRVGSTMFRVAGYEFLVPTWAAAVRAVNQFVLVR